MTIKESIRDLRGFTASMLSVAVLMIAIGFVSPHISLVALKYTGLIGVSLLTLGFFLARSFSSLIHSTLMIRYSVRFIGSLSILIIALTYLLYILLPPLTYPVVKVLEGFVSGLYWPLVQSLIVDSVAPGWRSRWLSIYFILGSISGYLGVQLGSLIISCLGPGYLVPLGLFIVAAYSLVFILLAPKTTPFRPGDPAAKPSLVEAFLEAGRISWLIPILLLMGGVNGLLRDYLFSLAKITTGYSEALLRYYWSLAGYTGLALSLVFSYLSEGRGYSRIVFLTGTLFTSSIILLPIATSSPALYFAMIASIIIGVRILRPIVRGYASRMTSRPEHGIALVNSIANISAGITPVIIALIQSITY